MKKLPEIPHPTGPPIKVTAAFCRDRLPDKDTLKLLPYNIPSEYPDSPGKKSYTFTSEVQFHPLQVLTPYLVALDNRALFEKVSREVDGAALASLLDWLRESSSLHSENGMVFLEYPFPTEDIPAPFISCMSQAGLVYLASMSYILTGRREDLDMARGALASFSTDYRKGGVRVSDRDSEGSPWYLEYANKDLPYEKLLFVLNGTLFSLQTLAKTLELEISGELQGLEKIYEDGVGTLRRVIHKYEAPWGWSFYDRTGQNRASAGYHSYQTLLLREIAARENDEELMAVAERWWTFYKIKLPFFFMPYKKTNLIEYWHPKGTYPHPYLNNEILTLITYRTPSGKKVLHTPELKSATISPAGTFKDSLNMERALFPEGSGEYEIWCFSEEETLGIPNFYLLDRVVETSGLKEAEFKIGEWIDCENITRSDDFMGWKTNQPAVFFSFLEDPAPVGPWQKNQKSCVHLARGVIPSRHEIYLPRTDFGVSFRGEYDREGPGQGWHLIRITSPDNLSGYQARQVCIILRNLDIDPSMFPYIEIPVLMNQGFAMSMDAVAPDGSVISRYTMADAPMEDIKHILVNWESFPGYQGKTISSILLRIYLEENTEEGDIAIGPLVLISGAEGVLSNLDFVKRDEWSFQTRLNRHIHEKVPLAYFRVPVVTLFELLLTKFTAIGQGWSPGQPVTGILSQSETCGMVVSSEVLRYLKFPGKEIALKIRKSVRRLLDGYTSAIQQENQKGSIDQAFSMMAVLDSLKLGSFWTDTERQDILDFIKRESLRLSEEVLASTVEGSPFQQQPSSTDMHVSLDTSSMLLGVLSRVLHEYGDIFVENDYKLIQERVEETARGLTSNILWNDGVVSWISPAFREPGSQDESPDLVRQVSFLWGMELYRHHGGSVPLTWSREQALESLDRFWSADGEHILEHPQNMPDLGDREPNRIRQASLEGAGLVLAFYATWGTQAKTEKVIRTIVRDYGPFPGLRPRPEQHQNNGIFYSRHAAPVLLGLALFSFEKGELR